VRRNSGTNAASASTMKMPTARNQRGSNALPESMTIGTMPTITQI